MRSPHTTTRVTPKSLSNSEDPAQPKINKANRTGILGLCKKPQLDSCPLSMAEHSRGVLRGSAPLAQCSAVHTLNLGCSSVRDSWSPTCMRGSCLLRVPVLTEPLSLACAVL